MTRKLALAIHFHQPVGNLDVVLERATDRCYRPFLEVLADHEDIPVTLHYSGCLLEWLEDRAEDVSDTLSALVARGQVELMTGGMYEPILAALPNRDQVGQIEMLTSHLRDRYATEPQGLWLTERVWEPDVIPSLTQTGIRYTVLDDTMFHSVGITDAEMHGPFVTEADGKALLVYPGDRNLRYLVPYKRVERVLDHLRAGDEKRLFVYGDDGEKFGEWPDTAERVYADGWLDSFFTGLSRSQDWLELTKLGDHAEGVEPVGRVYLPSSSYDEMMTWALPTDARLVLGRHRRRLAESDPDGVIGFLRGAPWRSFLAKYPEMNELHKRMLSVSRSVHDAGDPPDALRELYRAQCNCSYWHGSFGGVYLAFMRAALWHHLMKAEKATQQPPGAEVTDLDADYRDEVILTAGWGVAVIAPSRGGCLLELDDHIFGANLLATMSRYREAYHLEDESPAHEDEDAEEMAASAVRSTIDTSQLGFDDRQRAGLLDRVGDSQVDSYDLDGLDGQVMLSAHSEQIEINKAFEATENGLSVTYRLSSQETVATSLHVTSSVLPLSLGRDTDRIDVDLDDGTLTISSPEGEVGLVIHCSKVPAFSHQSVETYSATLEGLSPMRQGVEVVLSWDVELDRVRPFVVRLELVPLVSPAPDKKDLGVSV